MILELINQYPQIIDDIHQLIQSKTNDDIICQIRKFSSGKIQTIEYQCLIPAQWSTSIKDQNCITWVCIVKYPEFRDDIYCHPNPKIKKQEIIDFIIKPFIRDKQLDIILI